ncbi:PAS domain-containing sensor histidine kinase [Nonomuraea pusilla]|uniref:PAS domain-containing sensor histidine kinase n=1 Tax=Nonomuraea pusilla TaxID=46177 RepID=UPI00331DA1DF
MTPIGAVLPRILKSVPQAIWVVDPEGCILYVNPAGVAALGYDDESELRGRQSHDVLHAYRPDGSLFPASECRMLAPAGTGEPEHGDDEWFMRRDGSFFPASWWAAPIDLPDGRGVVYSFFDATEVRELERARRERDAERIRADESRAAQRRIMESVEAVHRRTARDLHDGAQQRLVSLLIGLRLAKELLPDGESAAAELLGHSIADAQTAIDELRELAWGIYPSVLTLKGLAAAVEDLATRCPIPAVVDSDGGRPLPSAVESNAYFVVAEAVTNAVKHARASRIDISLEFGEALRIRVADDGVGGVDLTTAGSGLTGLADRVAAFDGTLTVESPPGGGTTILALIPVPA